MAHGAVNRLQTRSMKRVTRAQEMVMETVMLETTVQVRRAAASLRPRAAMTLTFPKGMFAR